MRTFVRNVPLAMLLALSPLAEARAAKVVWSSRPRQQPAGAAAADSTAMRDSLARAAVRAPVAAKPVVPRRDPGAARAALARPAVPAANPPAAATAVATGTTVPRSASPASPPSIARSEGAVDDAFARNGLRTTRITYLAGTSAYLDAGQAEGITVGDTVIVLRDRAPVARLRVSFVSTHRASCDTLWTRATLAVGDAVSYRTDARRQAAMADSVQAVAARGDSIRMAAVLPAPTGRATVRSARVRGRAGARWLSVETDGGGSYRQPALDIRLDGRDGIGGHVDAALDVRSRRTVRTGNAGTQTEQFARVYRASTTLRDRGDRRRLTLGRQSSPTLASISLFDGALAEWGNDRGTLGAFTGTQPEPARLAWSGDLIEGGLYAEWHQRPLEARRWSVSTGAVTSRRGSFVNRDFLFAQGWWFSKGGSASVAQEVDLNSGWKRALGEPAVSWTSTFATVRIPVTPQFALQSGFDNRRSVRLWRDRETPETEFDDRYRQGAWGGGTLEWAQHVRGSGEYRMGSGGDRSDSWSLSGEVRRLSRWQGSARVRYSAFASSGSESRLLSWGVGLDPMPQSHGEFTGGTRTTRDRVSGLEVSERWQGVDFDLALGGRWYLNGGFEQQKGVAGRTRQVQAGVSVRL